MTTERIDQLLDEALATGTVPAGASEEERAEVERLVKGAGALRISRNQLEREAADSMPVARARFERHMASVQRGTPAAKPRRATGTVVFGWLFRAHRTLGVAATAASIAIVATVAMLVSQNVFNGVETATAQVLTPGDYVQVGGVVADATGLDGVRRVRVSSEFGEVDVALSDVTSVIGDAESKEPSSVKKGDRVLVSGLVGKDRTIAAQTLAISAPEAPPEKPPIRELKDFRPGIEGRVVLVSLGEDGQRAHAVIQVRRELLVVRISDDSLKALLQGGKSPLGALVVVGQTPGLPPGVFSLAPASAPGATRTPGPGEGGAGTVSPTSESSATRTSAGTVPTAPAGSDTGSPVAIKFTGFKAIVVGRRGNVLEVETPKGVVAVTMRLETRLVFVGSGLAREALTTDNAVVGHEVTISGILKDGRVIADLIVFGPKVR
ncbi:MAG: hypothetical protein HUU14_08825 [Dehalococcoidia bacterium]|nr:hypothetical protein [Chloroflexi bacterium CFX7]MCK6565907.1 hypothetical protein [Dehalococcoidia bacterium]NUQ55972.1 hypothetical protein [Dehalococcoidia bacterium]